MGMGGVISGILVAFLPETKDVHMPDTVEEIEERAKVASDKRNDKKMNNQKSNDKEREETYF